MSRRRGSAPEQKTDTMRWLVSYADFITVMMIFFIVLWTTARVDTDRFQQLGHVVSMAFFPTGNLMPQPGPPGAGGLGTGMSDEPLDEEVDEEPPLWDADVPGAGDGDGDGGMDPDDLPWPIGSEVLLPGLHPWTGLPISPEEAGFELIEQLPEFVESGELSVVQTERGIVISLQNSILFDSGSADLRPEAYRVLAEVADALQQTDKNVLIEGYTDNVPIQTAAFPSNWELSAARAMTVLRQLLDTTDLDPDRFAVVGYGEYRNMYPNDTEANRQKNRRVDIVILDERLSLNVGKELQPAR